MKATLVGLASSLAFFAVVSGTALAQENVALAAKAKEILKANCYRCHGQDGRVEGGLNYILDSQQLVDRKKVVPADPMKSPHIAHQTGPYHIVKLDNPTGEVKFIKEEAKEAAQ